MSFDDGASTFLVLIAWLFAFDKVWVDIGFGKLIAFFSPCLELLGVEVERFKWMLLG